LLLPLKFFAEAYARAERRLPGESDGNGEASVRL